ncbi:type 2 isopentenyl-diphosphate Delta-isomerase [Lactobacillus kullabergensis]|uniref:Isopentenyl-diphosphate delta-isomerase n=1 Tax=Lactobacillus kullabergensis TaxID=1218493 RepID=A0ABM6W072_9LACO|nr:type 2 isopentenyl-diphosphate Delta-isomerase [Lactobacillus kullabergensis]AWM75329.1 type 2 isopentenyl-diphosphate Delta-isomerase [Lactobacillus kullabergensis]
MSIRSNRKEEHLDLAQKFYQNEKPNSFDKMHLVRPALPETKVDLRTIQTTMFGKMIAAPFFINAMTGGSRRSYLINKELGRIAKKTNIALALGSASILTKEPDLLDSFLIARQQDPDGALIANVNAKTSAEQAEKIVTELKADALQIHLNVVQEIAMPEGDRDFYWLDNLKELRQKVTVPIIIKEVGFGLDRDTIRSLKKEGFGFYDVAGSGGTNFAQIENARNTNNVSYLNNIGLSTVVSSLMAAKEQVEFTVSGGVRSPLDVFKGLCLGGKFVGISNVFLQALIKHDADYLQNLIEEWQYELACLLAIYGQNDLFGLTKIDKYYDFSLKTIIDQLL